MAERRQESEQERRGEQPEAGDRAELERQVLAMVEDLAQELNPRRKVKARPQASLQRDLGFDSLGLSELMLRTEKEFKVKLPDDLLGRIETPDDLVTEIAERGGAEGAEFALTTERLPEASVEPAPDSAATLNEVLAWHAEHNGERAHILLSDGYRETDTITYRDLADSAGRLAGALQAWGLEPGERVGIMLPTSREFFEAYFGALLAGGVPVPMYPPIRMSQLEEHLRRQAGILRNSQAALLFIPEEGKALSGLLGAQIDTLRDTATVDGFRSRDADPVSVSRAVDDLAMLQYTSGSTGDPKGVMLSHANLLSNIRAMGRAIDASSDDVFVSWLPLYHDLGLIGAWLGSLYYAAPVVIMSPLRFIVRPESWLWAMHRNKATLSAAPNFAYELCVKKIEDEAIEGLSLSSLRLVANGAEPVSAHTIRRFTERFEPYGFRPEMLAPVYGLAENAVGVAFTPLGEPPRIERISRKALSQEGRAELAGEDEKEAMELVSCGVPLPDNEIRVVDDAGHEAGEREQGRLQFRGPSSTRGYFRNEEKTRSLFDGDWLDTGDLAYIADGRLFITARVKDIIIKAGRNIYPEEIEEAVGELDGIRKGCVAAFASAEKETRQERLIVVAETREKDAAERDRLRETVEQKAYDIVGMPPDDVVIASPHAVPKTSSGKIRRSATRELYEKGEIGKPARPVWMQVTRLGLMSGLSYVRRLAQSVGRAAYAAWWWLVLVALAMLVWPAVLLLPTRALRWRFVHSVARCGLALMGIPLEISHAERLSDKAGVIVANHSSYFDVVVLAAILPGQPAFLAKQELAGQFVAGPFLRRLGARFADRAVAQAGVEEAEALKDLARGGQRLVIFPEATFTRMPGLLSFRLGAFAIAAAAGTAVLPLVLSGTRSILRGGQWLPRRGRVKVQVLEPVEPEGEDFDAVVALRDRTRERMLERGEEPDMAERQVSFAQDEDERAD